MENNNSHASEIAGIVTETIADAYGILRLWKPARKVWEVNDQAYVQRRVTAEGIKFLTSTLPVMGEWFDDRILKREQVSRPVGFHPYDNDIPLFLSPLVAACSDESIEPSSRCLLVRLVRTILFGCKKLEVPPSPEMVKARIDNFCEIEKELEEQFLKPSTLLIGASELLTEFFGDFVPQIERPRHGPGAVAGREKGAGKWDFDHYPKHTHKVFPAWDLWPLKEAVSVPGVGRSLRRIQLAAEVKKYKKLVLTDKAVSRVLVVPKDSKGPRIISCEPKELMYLQQGINATLTRFIERHPWTSGHVNFADQTVNRRLAQSSSKEENETTYATIDLSDASDRVSLVLVNRIFPTPVFRVLEALRSTHAMLPDGNVIELLKYAPMGSALCFPVESLVFWAVCVSSLYQKTGSLTKSLDVFVYGDDIIVPTEHASTVIEALEEVGLKVNHRKSLIGSYPFRESCGIDAYQGYDVTPYRLRKFPPQRSSDGNGCVAYLQYASNRAECSPRSSLRCAHLVERFLGPIPRTRLPQGFLSIVDPPNAWEIKDYPGVRWSVADSYPKAKLLTAKMRSTRVPLDGWPGVQKSVIELTEGQPPKVVTTEVTLIRRRSVVITDR